MRRSDPLVWDQRSFEHNAVANDEGHRASERSLREQAWSILQSWWVTAFVVLLSAIEAFVVIALALFDLSFIQDYPDSTMLAADRNVTCQPLADPANATTPPSTSDRGGSSGTSEQILVRAVLNSVSLAIGTLFLVEMTLKLIAGGSRFCTDIIEMADFVVVITVACLGALFWSYPPLAARGWRLLQLIVLLRLLRCARLVAVLVEVRSRTLSRQLSDLQRERQTAENKSEVLILKVEDLEHEVAYLKEKLKKAEREFSITAGLAAAGGRKSVGGIGGHRKLRDTFSLTSCCGSAVALASVSGTQACPMSSVVAGVSTPTLADVSHSGVVLPLDHDTKPSAAFGGRRPSQYGSSLGAGLTSSNHTHSAHTQTSGLLCDVCKIPQTIDFMAARLGYLALKHAISALQVQSNIQSSAGTGAGTGSGPDDTGNMVPAILAATGASVGSGSTVSALTATTLSGSGDVSGQNTLSARRPPARLLPVPLSVATPLVSPGLSSLESGYSSCLSSASRHPQLSSASPYGSLGESMPTSWSASGSGSSAALCCYSSSRRGSRGTVFLFPDLQRRTDSLESQGTMSVELNVLDEVAETELSPGATALQQPLSPSSQAPPSSEADYQRRRQMVRGTAICHREGTVSIDLETGAKRGSADPVPQHPGQSSSDLLNPDQPPGPSGTENAKELHSTEGSRDPDALHHENQGTCKLPMTSL